MNVSEVRLPLKVAGRPPGMFRMGWNKERMNHLNLLFPFFMFCKIFSRNPAKKHSFHEKSKI